MAHYDYSLMWPLRDSTDTFSAVLAPGDTAEAPGTTKKYFKGPGFVRYQMYADGGMYVLDRGQVTLEFKGLSA